MSCHTAPHPAWAVRLSAIGTTVWQSPLQGSDSPPVAPIHSATHPSDVPLVTGRVVVAANGDAATGLRLSDGRTLWHWSGAQQIVNLWQWHGVVAALTADDRLTGLRATTGAVVWTLSLAGRSGPSGLAGQSAQTGDGGLAVGTEAGGLEMINLADGTVRWRRSASAGNVGSFIATDGMVVATLDVGHGQLAGYDDRTGTVRWSDSADSPSFLTVLSDGSFAAWLLAKAPTLAVSDPRSGRIRWQFDIPRGAPQAVLPVPGTPRGASVVLTTDQAGQKEQESLLSLSDGALRESASLPFSPLPLPVIAGQDIVGFQISTSDLESLTTVRSTDIATGATQWAQQISSSATGPFVVPGSQLVLVAAPPRADSGQTSSTILAYHAATGRSAWVAILPAPLTGTPTPVAGGIVAETGQAASSCATAG